MILALLHVSRLLWFVSFATLQQHRSSTLGRDWWENRKLNRKGSLPSFGASIHSRHSVVCHASYPLSSALETLFYYELIIMRCISIIAQRSFDSRRVFRRKINIPEWVTYKKRWWIMIMPMIIIGFLLKIVREITVNFPDKCRDNHLVCCRDRWVDGLEVIKTQLRFRQSDCKGIG